MRRGFSLLEVLVLVVVVGLAFLPVFSLGSATHRRAFFDEHQQLAQARAKLMLDLAAALDFTLLSALAGGQVSREVVIDMEALLGAAPMRRLVEPFVATRAAGYQLKLANLRHRVTFVLHSAWIGRIGAEVTWVYPGDTRGQVHSVRLARIVARREGAFGHSVPLR